MDGNIRNVKDNLGSTNSLNQADSRGGKSSPAVPVLQKQAVNSKSTTHVNNQNKLSSDPAGQVAQLQQIEFMGINGLTHLVMMTDGGSLYNSEDWLKNEGEEVKTGDLLAVDVDDKVLSRRGINQETNWKQDASGGSKNLWVRVIELNHKKLGPHQYVRMEMLSEGTEAIPKTMHSIWVQGDYRDNPEAQTGIATRAKAGKEGWVNMIWLYNSGKEDNGFRSDLQTESMPVDTGKFPRIFERSFVQEMARWKRSGSMPKWVDKWLPILQVLMEKKSYITISDLMRMIILYYEGGVYMDVKIQVDAKSNLASAPNVLINTVNFYDRENWAIMANTGCRMIEEIMIKTLDQFPSIEELNTYPENYQDVPGKEGKTHADLHENKGVWRTIEKYRQHTRETSLILTNPRPVNSWADTYEDRDPKIVLAERTASFTSSLKNLESKLSRAMDEKGRLEQNLTTFRSTPPQDILSNLQKTTEEIETLKKTKENLNSALELAVMELNYLENPPPDNDDDDDILNMLAGLDVPKKTL